LGATKNIVEHHESEGQHRRHAQNIQRIRQRDETPFGGGQIEGVADHHTERDEIGQDAQQQRQTIEKRVTLEAQIETRQHRERGRERVVRRNQRLRKVRFERRIIWLTGNKQYRGCEAADSLSRASMPAVMIWRNCAAPMPVRASLS
jgi:hypothetical protein